MEKIKEQWCEIKGYNGRYRLSNYGEVMSVYKYAKSRLLKSALHRGYKSVTLFKNGKGKTQLIHRLVAEYFIKNPDNKICVNHKDFNRLNNNVENLEWCTHKENSHHAWINGRYKDTGQGKPVIKTHPLYPTMILDRYDTETKASFDNNISVKAINNCLRNRSKTAGGFVWNYAK
jgi:hypothetical protein